LRARTRSCRTKTDGAGELRASVSVDFIPNTPLIYCWPYAPGDHCARVAAAVDGGRSSTGPDAVSEPYVLGLRQRTVISLLVVAVAVAAGLALPQAARADLALWFASPRAHWGERVVVRSPGRYAPFSGVRTYLVPMALARAARYQRPTGPPRDPRIIPLGPLELKRRAVATLSFVVPHVRPGDYTIGFWCKPCAPARGSFFTTARPDQNWSPDQRRIVRISR
jgi:hypothetical protein